MPKTWRPSVRAKIWSMVALFLLGLGGLSLTGLFADQAMLIDEKRHSLRRLVESARSIVSHYHQLERSGQLSGAHAREGAREALRAMRYDEVEYFWINSLAEVPHMVMHPTRPDLEGQPLLDSALGLAHAWQSGDAGEMQKFDRPTPLFIAFNEVARTGGQGFVSYLWPKPLGDGGATESQYPKLSYVMRFDPWGWVIGSGVYVDDVGALVRERLAGRARLVLLIAVPLIALAALLATTITRPLLRGARALEAMRQGRRRLAALPVERDDEIGTLIDGFNRLQNDLKDKTEALARSNAELEQLATVFTHAREGVMITAPDGTILNVNQSFSRISGYSRDELIGSNPRMLKSGHQDDVFYAGMWQALTHTGHWSGEIWNRHKQGHLYAELLTISAVRDAHGQTRHYVSLISDITTQKEYQQQLEYIAHYDVLTALPNRMLLADRLRQAIAQAQRERCRVAVVYIDLDGFKAINDTHGHAAGDALLMAVAQRMQQCLRGQDTIARLGGDEFVALLTALPEQYDVRPLAQRLLEAASLPVQHGALQLQVSCSIGITYHDPGGPGDEEQLLIEADQAMYQAKLAGKNTLHVYGQGQGQAPTPAPCTTSGLS